MSRTVPVTKGVAELVPLPVAPMPPCPASTTATPGAETSGLTRPSSVGPRLENQGSEKPPAPVSASAPTVTADCAAPGALIVQLAGPPFPAAAITTIPAATAASTACDAT